MMINKGRKMNSYYFQHPQNKLFSIKKAIPWFLGLFIMAVPLLSPNTVLAQDNDLGESLFEEGKIDEAEVQFKNVLKSNSKDAKANYFMGRIEFSRNSYGDATKWFEKAVKYESDNSYYNLWLGRAFGRRAQSASKLKQPFLARKTKSYFEKAVELDSDNVLAREDLISYYLQAPGFLGGSVAKAKEQADEIKKRNPIMGHFAWADIYDDQEEPQKVENEYYQAITSYPDSAAPYYRLINLYVQQQRYDEALPISNKVVEVDTSSANSLFSKGNVLQQMESFEEAISTYDELLAQYPDQHAAYYQIGRVASISGTQLEKGEQSMLSYINSEFEPGENSLKWAHYRLGLIYEHMNRNNQAKSEYETALKFDKKFDEAKKALRALN